jgi:hypothetical protein
VRIRDENKIEKRMEATERRRQKQEKKRHGPTYRPNVACCTIWPTESKCLFKQLSTFLRLLEVQDPAW